LRRPKRRARRGASFLEGSHRRDYLNFLVNHPFPTFTGSDGDTTRAFRLAMHEYTTACNTYGDEIERFSELQTDCVGITIVDYHRGRGQRSSVVCP
jgi:hypothetical protein